MRTYFSPASSISESRSKELIVTRIAQPEIVQEATIDLVDDLQMARQQSGEQR